MKIFLDNMITKKLIQTSFLQKHADLFLGYNIQFEWSNLFSCLGMDQLLKKFPVFDLSNPLFRTYVEAFQSPLEKEDIYNYYDHLFAQHLSSVRALKELAIDQLIQSLNTFEKNDNSLKNSPFLLGELQKYKIYFTQYPQKALHDLTLYLAWDRLCVSIGNLFDHQCLNTHFQQSVQIFKECLIESFQHIYLDRKTKPGFFRFTEALFYFYMREENLTLHSEEEWQLLCHYSQVAADKNRLPDFYTVDCALLYGQQTHQIKLRVIGDEKIPIIERRTALSQFILAKIKQAHPYEFDLAPIEFIDVNSIK